jgi:RimJ/RimL family protein N-acetyltransferase
MSGTKRNGSHTKTADERHAAKAVKTRPSSQPPVSRAVAVPVPGPVDGHRDRAWESHLSHGVRFPEKFVGKDGRVYTLDLLDAPLARRLPAFFARFSDNDRLFLQEDPTRPETPGRWAGNVESGRLTAVVARDPDGGVVAVCALHRRLWGWTRHIGYMQIFVLPEFSGQGLATVLIRRITDIAAQTGLDKVVTEILVRQRRERKILKHVGFRREALLHAHACDLEGKRLDILLMSNHVYELWRSLEDLILDQEFEVVP